MGIFKNITKTLKKAAPIIGAGIGMYFGGPMGASIGSGIGSLAGGRSTEEALRNAALAGGTAYLATGAGTPGAGMKNFNTSGSPLRSMFQGADTIVRAPDAIKGTGSSSIIDMIKNNPVPSLALAGSGIAALGGLDDDVVELAKERPFAEGKTRLGYGRIGNKQYNLDDPVELERYRIDNRNRTIYSAAGGEVNGPGTGTSDSVPARLSDGEFVVTAKAVRGAGGGDRDVGAARMYDMMSQLEGAA